MQALINKPPLAKRAQKYQRMEMPSRHQQVLRMLVLGREELVAVGRQFSLNNFMFKTKMHVSGIG